MADVSLEVFRRALLGRGFFAHVAPLRSRPGVASVIWESLVSMRRCSREHFVDNRSAHSFFIYIDTSGQTHPSGGSLRVLGVCKLVRHRLVMPLLLRPQLVMHWLVMHALAKDSPGWPGDVSVTDVPCVHAIYMENHRRQTMDSCKKLMVSVCEITPFPFSPLGYRASLDARTPRIRHTFFQEPRWPTVGSSWVFTTRSLAATYFSTSTTLY